MLNYCNNIAHLCLRASQSLFITSHLNARLVDDQLPCTSLGWIRGGLYGGADTEGWIPGYRPWDGHRGFRTSGVVDEQLQLLFNVSKHVLLGLREGGVVLYNVLSRNVIVITQKM